METLRTQVGIIGAGPSGLLLGKMLHNRGVDTLILETKSENYVRSRLRAGVMEQTTVDTLIAEGVGDRLQKECIVHKGVYLNFNDQSHYLNAAELTGGNVVRVYGQKNITCDMIDHRKSDGQPLLFEANATSITNVTGKVVSIHFEHQGENKLLECDFVAGCDGFHGISRKQIPSSLQQTFQQKFPFAWFGILAEAPPAVEEVIYAHSARGFALQSMRSKTLSRHYIQVPEKENIQAWSDTDFYDEFEKRIGAGYRVNRGKIIDKSLAHFRSFVSEPMSFGKLFLAGDAAHIVPPTGAKGMNLSIADVRVLGEALFRYYQSNDDSLLKQYSDICLNRVWKVERFSWWFTNTTHKKRDQTPFETKMQLATLQYIVDSKIGSHSFVENFVGLPYENL